MPDSMGRPTQAEIDSWNQQNRMKHQLQMAQTQQRVPTSPVGSAPQQGYPSGSEIMAEQQKMAQTQQAPKPMAPAPVRPQSMAGKPPTPVRMASEDEALGGGKLPGQTGITRPMRSSPMGMPQRRNAYGRALQRGV